MNYKVMHTFRASEVATYGSYAYVGSHMTIIVTQSVVELRRLGNIIIGSLFMGRTVLWLRLICHCLTKQCLSSLL